MMTESGNVHGVCGGAEQLCKQGQDASGSDSVAALQSVRDDADDNDDDDDDDDDDADADADDINAGRRSR